MMSWSSKCQRFSICEQCCEREQKLKAVDHKFNTFEKWECCQACMATVNFKASSASRASKPAEVIPVVDDGLVQIHAEMEALRTRVALLELALSSKARKTGAQDNSLNVEWTMEGDPS
jgi:hypothetical protein